MALSVTDPAGVAVFSTLNQTTYTTASFTPTANDRLYVFAQSTGAAVTAIAISDSLSSTFTSEIADTASINNGHFAVWSLDVGASPAARTVTLTATGGATGATIVILRVAGTTPLSTVQAKAVTGAGANPAITMASALNTNNAYMAFVSEDAGANGQWTAGVMASWTVDEDSGYSTPAARSGAAHRVNGESGSTLTWTNAGTGNWIFSVVEVQQSSGGTTTNQALTATVALTASFQNQVSKSLAATVGLSPSLQKLVSKSLSATVALTASLVTQKVKLQALTATVAAVASMSRQTNKAVTATVATVASIRRTTTKTISATVALAATINKTVTKRLTATVAAIASLTAQWISGAVAVMTGYFSSSPSGMTGNTPAEGDYDAPTPRGQ